MNPNLFDGMLTLYQWLMVFVSFLALVYGVAAMDAMAMFKGAFGIMLSVSLPSIARTLFGEPRYLQPVPPTPPVWEFPSLSNFFAAVGSGLFSVACVLAAAGCIYLAVKHHWELRVRFFMLAFKLLPWKTGRRRRLLIQL